MKPALEKRLLPRTKMVLPLRSSAPNSSDGTAIAVHTLDLSLGGARLGAFHQDVKPGDVLTVQRQHKRAKCKVVWVREIAPREIQVGVEFLGSENGFWGVPLEDSPVGVWTFKSDGW